MHLGRRLDSAEPPAPTRWRYPWRDDMRRIGHPSDGRCTVSHRGADVRRPPTDFELLKEIYTRTRDDFAGYVQGAPGARASKILVPVDLQGVADHFGVDADTVFGRLYFHLDPKYGQEPDQSGVRKVFFVPLAGSSDQNCINFPLLEAVLAGLWQEQRRDLWAVATAVVSLVIALASLAVSILTATGSI